MIYFMKDQILTQKRQRELGKREGGGGGMEREAVW